MNKDLVINKVTLDDDVRVIYQNDYGDSIELNGNITNFSTTGMSVYDRDCGHYFVEYDSIVRLDKTGTPKVYAGKMSPETFKALLEELDASSVNTLIEKNARYSSNDDCLHNFRSGGEIFGGTPAQACWGYLTKHLVALRDMVQRDDFSNREDFLEKCQDSINYIRFLWCIGNNKEKENES